MGVHLPRSIVTGQLKKFQSVRDMGPSSQAWAQAFLGWAHP